jgi:hypothetical protein
VVPPQRERPAVVGLDAPAAVLALYDLHRLDAARGDSKLTEYVFENRLLHCRQFDPAFARPVRRAQLMDEVRRTDDDELCGHEGMTTPR